MNIKKFCVYPNVTLKKAMEVIDESAKGICILVDHDLSFKRTITDGDIRRALLRGHVLEDTLEVLPEIQSVTAQDTCSANDFLNLMKQFNVRCIPILNQNKPIDLIERKDLESPILLSAPHIGEDEKVYVQDAFDSNWIAPLGPNVEKFEEEMAQFIGVAAALATSSGTAALHLALELLNVKKDDFVFCSSFTFVATANPILYQHAIPVFIDSHPETWNMCPKALDRAFQHYSHQKKLPKAVIVANIYGQSADMDSLLKICQHYEVPLIEDSAESLGAYYKGKPSGTMGLLGIYSFNGNKIITTSGGGMLVSNDANLIAQARFLATQAKDDAPYYLHSKVGYNYRMSNVLAGIGRGQLKVLKERVASRRQIFQTYFEQLNNHIFEFMPEPEGYFSTRWLSCMYIKKQSKFSVENMVFTLARRGIETRRLWKPLHTQPLFKGMHYFPHKEDYSYSDKLFTTGICLPSSSNINTEKQERIINAIKVLESEI
jgi:dTDP-4-amino-4,6-dideoxygalactose transaminase